ncbi:GlxA family transcriptional regulator [Hwanghaeella sp.]|uniref:GlxA family transcriptional regulator n=1 Tax=Hwanghaeella sp. TaxID=2605943 RepID=UPI003CCBA551
MVAQSDILAEIGVLIYPDCQLAAVYGLTDLFRIAGEWSVRDPDKKGPRPAIRVSHWQAEESSVDGSKGEPVCVWDSHAGLAHRLDYVIAPPSIIMPEDMKPMTLAAKWLSDRHAAGSRVCSVCAGAFVLAESGLLDGRRVTTHWAFAAELGERFPSIDVAEENIVLDDGDIMTAGGILAWADLGLTLVERFMGPSAMLATSQFLLIDPPRKSQQPFRHFLPRFDHGDEVILKSQHHLQASVTEPHSVKELAAGVGLTERTFLRRFARATGHRPTEYLQQLRIAKARETLELTNRSVDRIAWQVGYQDTAAFRKVFQKYTGISPHLYRQRFGVYDRKPDR